MDHYASSYLSSNQENLFISSPTKSKKNIDPTKIYYKCIDCAKKVFITSKCRCGSYYCGNHMKSHNCNFNYKTLNSGIQKVAPEKIIKF